MLKFASINSGSNGNCYYIGNEHDAVLVDAGISCRETVRRMLRVGLSMEKVRAIFISHEHTDHTRGAEVISRKYGIPVYITDKTHHHSRLSFEPELRRSFSAYQPVAIGSLWVSGFPKSHDAADPHSFIIENYGLTVGVFTDIGIPCDHLNFHLAQCDAAFLESNYDEGMLDRGRYPLYLKRRIRGKEGHLSNHQALDLFLTHQSGKLKLLILSHLSAENNHPDLVRRMFREHAVETRVEVASRYEESEVFILNQEG